MGRWATLTLALLFAAVLTVRYVDTASSQDGWTPLFDGKNIDQWDGDGSATFKIEDGAIVAVDKKDTKPTASSYLISKKPYKDFMLRAEFWVSNDANSGIFIRCNPKQIGAKTCYEFNIFDTRPDPTYGTGAIVYIAEVNPMPKAGGKWSTMDITVKGRQLTLVFDGQKTVDVRNGLWDEGHIALQFGTGTVKFRKVDIKPL